MKTSGVRGFSEPFMEGNYELEKILHRICCCIWLHVPVWFPLVREADEWSASGGANSLANRCRFWQSLLSAGFWAYCNGVFPHAGLWTVRSGGRRRRVRDVSSPDSVD